MGISQRDLCGAFVTLGLITLIECFQALSHLGNPYYLASTGGFVVSNLLILGMLAWSWNREVKRTLTFFEGTPANLRK